MARSVQFQVKNLSDLTDVVEFLSDYLKPMTLFLFDGPMAAGKTTLISELLKTLKLNYVHSPTYALHHLYKTDFCDIHHFDLYRLTSEDEIESSGFWDYFYHQEDIFFVEWANVVSFDQWPLGFNIIQIEISQSSEEIRQFQITIH
jgi:tRNA threonylcarbamoyladenosine biosynthesis protein TsaE